MLATRDVIVWKYARAMDGDAAGESVAFPLIDWINLFAPEIEVRKAVAKMHASIFPDSPFGNISE